MRVAMVSPLPPAPTGIADYTIDVVKALRSAHSIELFHGQERVSGELDAPVFPIADLPVRHARAPYDAVVYKMGNAPAHDFMYEWMERVPGGVVLHDLVLHHSFARRFLESEASRVYAQDPSSRENRARALESHRGYLEGVESVYPGQGERLKDAHLNTTGDLLPYAYPLFEPALAHARAAGAHNAFMVEAMKTARPRLSCVPLAMPISQVSVSAGAVAALRARLGLPAGEAVIGCFGLVTREKRIETVARAAARIAGIQPNVRLLLAGEVSDRAWLDDLLGRLGVARRTTAPGRLNPEEFAAAMNLSDVAVHLRYPTARETSAALLRVMAQGRPVIISDIANQAEIPNDAVRRIESTDEEGELARALDALLRNPESARAMGERALRHVAEAHSGERTRETYGRLLKSLAPHYS